VSPDTPLAVALATDPSTAERRSHLRYPVEFDLHYRFLGRRGRRQEGAGKTCNLSKGGIFFCADRSLPEGLSVELSIDWPVRLEGKCLLRLRIAGTIVRSSEMGTAVKTTRYEFYTRGSVSSASRPSGFGSITLS
jgi:hypothetical protein